MECENITEMTPEDAKKIIHGGKHNMTVIERALELAEDALNYRSGMVADVETDDDGEIDGKRVLRQYRVCGKCYKTLYMVENYCPRCGMRIL